jgi:hypothetical protein
MQLVPPTNVSITAKTRNCISVSLFQRVFNCSRLNLLRHIHTYVHYFYVCIQKPGPEAWFFEARFFQIETCIGRCRKQCLNNFLTTTCVHRWLQALVSICIRCLHMAFLSIQLLLPVFLSQRPLVPLLLLGPPFFPIILFGSKTLLTGMTGNSLHMQWPLTLLLPVSVSKLGASAVDGPDLGM